MQADKILKLVRLTEKSNKLSSETGQYTFEVTGTPTSTRSPKPSSRLFKVTVRQGEHA